MNRFLQMIMLFGLLEEAGAEVTGAVAVADPVSSAPAPAADPVSVADPIAGDSSDPMAALEAAMNAALPQDDPATPDPAAVAAQPSAEFEPLLKVSPFVTAPEHVQSAIQAADEVWKVASGQVPARTLLEGLKTANPQQFDAIANDLREYLGVPQAEVNPFDAFKQSNPAEFKQIADFYQQVTGKSIDGPADPVQSRLSSLEQRIAREDQERQQAQYMQQVQTAYGKAMEFLSSKAKGTFAEGSEQYFLQQIGAKSGIPEQEMVQMLLQGKTEKLEAAYKAVAKEESARLKVYTKNMVKQYRTLSGAVPAVKGGATQSAPQAAERLPGESIAEHAVRVWKNGK
jgi:hypothetical protein